MKNNPIEGIPNNPNTLYKNEGWSGFNNWLGNDKFKRGYYLEFKEARKYVLKMKINGVHEWERLCKEHIVPEFIPSKPHETYKGKGWISYTDWLGGRKKRKKLTDKQRHDMSKIRKGKMNIKKYALLDPLGNEHITNNGLTLFCEQNNLTISIIRKTLTKERNHHKGWKILREIK